MGEYKTAITPNIEAFTNDTILNRETIEIARKVLMAAERHGSVELYIDGKGRLTIRRSSVIYASDLPGLWLVGTYNSLASTIRVMEDIELRLTEVAAANG